MIRETVVGALEPWVGSVAADTCVRATALAVGKDISEFGQAEVAALCVNVRRLLSPVAPSAAVDGVIAQIEVGAA